jgi:hypothetical protein
VTCGSSRWRTGAHHARRKKVAERLNRMGEEDKKERETGGGEHISALIFNAMVKK